MSEFLPALGILAGLVSTVSYVFYIHDMVYGATRPERASWLIWLVLNIISLTAQIAEGGKWSLLMTLAHTLGLSTVLVLSIKFGYGGLKRRDVIGLGIAALGLVGWALTNNPIVALLFVVGVNIVGNVLTLYKTYYRPESETLIAWCLDCAGAMLAVLAVGALNPALLIMPVYTVLATAAVVITIYIGRSRKNTSAKM